MYCSQILFIRGATYTLVQINYRNKLFFSIENPIPCYRGPLWSIDIGIVMYTVRRVNFIS